MSRGLPRGPGSLLALDVSRRRIGLAGTDPERRLVTPLFTFARGRKWAQDVARLAAVIREREVGGLVVGLPLNMDGSEGPMAQAARAFARNLEAAFGLPIRLQDERLTTFAVEDAIAEGRLPRPKRKGEPLDHYAAAVILEDCLRALAREPGSSPADWSSRGSLENAMEEEKAKRPPLGSEDAVKEGVKEKPIGPQEHVTKEAVRKDQEAVREIMRPGPPPDPGIEEDYGKRSGEIPSQEPGNPKRKEPAPPT